MDDSVLARVLNDGRLNAAVGWVLIVLVALLAAGSLLRNQVLSAGFALVIVGLALVPPLEFRNPRAMLPWEVLVLASLPVLGRTFVLLSGLGTGRLANYVAVAAIALVAAVELHVFTPVRMNRGFAIAFVILTTMAAAGVWAVARWIPDVLLGTGFLLQPGLEEATIERNLMLDFVASTVAGVVGGVVFQFYFCRHAPLEERIVEGSPESRGLL
jgi:hypothetical protein